MTNKEIATFKDSILTELNKQDSSVSKLSDSLKISFETIWTLSKDIDKEGLIHFELVYSMTGEDALLNITQEGKHFTSNNSYLSLFESNKKNQTSITRTETTKTVLIIGATIISVVLGVLNYIDSNTIEKQSLEIEGLEILIDSLKNNQLNAL